MTYIIISILMIIIGLIGIWKNKMPKFDVSPGYAALIKFYFSFYVIIILGVIFPSYRIQCDVK